MRAPLLCISLLHQKKLIPFCITKKRARCRRTRRGCRPVSSAPLQSQQIHLPISLCISRLPPVGPTKRLHSPESLVRYLYAQILLSKGIISFAELTAQECIELPPPKNNAQQEHLQLGQSLELKRAFVIFANIRRD